MDAWFFPSSPSYVNTNNCFALSTKLLASLLTQAGTAGATIGDTVDLGWMYQGSFKDLGGHHSGNELHTLNS